MHCRLFFCPYFFLIFPSAAVSFISCCRKGALAQLVERLVRNEKVRGSTPLSSTAEAQTATSPSDFFVWGRFPHGAFSIAALSFQKIPRCLLDSVDGLSSRSRKIHVIIVKRCPPGNSELYSTACMLQCYTASFRRRRIFYLYPHEKNAQEMKL